MRELECREAQFRVVQDKGESLIMERHPAPRVIEVRPHINIVIFLTYLNQAVTINNYVGHVYVIICLVVG